MCSFYCHWAEALVATDCKPKSQKLQLKSPTKAPYKYVNNVSRKWQLFTIMYTNKGLNGITKQQALLFRADQTLPVFVFYCYHDKSLNTQLAIKWIV